MTLKFITLVTDFKVIEIDNAGQRIQKLVVFLYTNTEVSEK